MGEGHLLLRHPTLRGMFCVVPVPASDGEDEALFRLYRAAPALLEACEYALEVLDPEGAFAPTYKKLEAAIVEAKAKRE